MGMGAARDWLWSGLQVDVDCRGSPGPKRHERLEKH